MMELTPLQKELAALLPGVLLCFNEPMYKHTSFQIGGNAEVMAFPKNTEELSKILNKSMVLDCKIAILGAGTNILAPDEGISGLIICLKDCLDGLELLEDNCIRVNAGVTMSRAAVFAAKNGLSGMEFAHGIPGTVGGGVYMNAGAYGGEIKDICTRVDVMDLNGDIRTLSCADMDFSYRHSRLEDEGGIVVSAVFQLFPRSEAEVRERMQELLQKRKTSQPLEYPSAGSAFKRPVGGYAAALIDQAGLKGFRIGGAAVSEKHAGFVVNLGGATSADVVALLKQVADIVKEKFDIQLEPEVRIW